MINKNPAQMKYLKILILFCFLTASQICLAEPKIDTITNWQVYKGSRLLFRSNEFDCYKPTGVIKKADNFKDFKIIFFRDTQSYGKQKIQFFSGKDLLAVFNFENKEELKIPKSEIQKLFSKTETNLTIKYFDEKERKGILLGYLLLKN